MEKKYDCEVVQDLICLYAEDMVSEKSRSVVEAHIAECETCAKLLEGIKTEPSAELNSTTPEQQKKQLSGLRRRLRLYGALIAFAAVFVSSLIWGLCISPGDEMGYSLIAFYFLLPLASFVCTVLTAYTESKLMWVLPLVFGAAGVVLPAFVFKSVGFSAGSLSLDGVSLLFGFVPSLLGLLVTFASKKLRLRLGKKRFTIAVLCVTLALIAAVVGTQSSDIATKNRERKYLNSGYALTYTAEDKDVIGSQELLGDFEGFDVYLCGIAECVCGDADASVPLKQALETGTLSVEKLTENTEEIGVYPDGQQVYIEYLTPTGLRIRKAESFIIIGSNVEAIDVLTMKLIKEKTATQTSP